MEKEASDKMICARCGFIGKKERFSKGSYLLEIFLWTMLFIPGVIYTTWRAFNERYACPFCQNETLTPLDSSLGKKIVREKERMQKPIDETEFIEILSKLKQ